LSNRFSLAERLAAVSKRLAGQVAQLQQQDRLIALYGERASLCACILVAEELDTGGPLLAGGERLASHTSVAA